MRMREAAGVPATSYDEWLFRFRVIQRILDELDEELLPLSPCTFGGKQIKHFHASGFAVNCGLP